MWTDPRRCSRTSSSESSEGWPKRNAGPRDPSGLEAFRPEGCDLIRFDPTTYRYKSRRPDQAALEQRIKEICQTRVRFGYRRVHVLLRREGWQINAKKTYRVYKVLGMQLRNKTPKRRVKG